MSRPRKAVEFIQSWSWISYVFKKSIESKSLKSPLSVVNSDLLASMTLLSCDSAVSMTQQCQRLSNVIDSAKSWFRSCQWLRWVITQTANFCWTLKFTDSAVSITLFSMTPLEPIDAGLADSEHIWKVQNYLILNLSDEYLIMCRNYKISSLVDTGLIRYWTYHILNLSGTELIRYRNCSDPELIRYQIFQISNSSDTVIIRYRTCHIPNLSDRYRTYRMLADCVPLMWG